MNTEIALKPSYWASVSGGKDSLYMLYLILHNLDKYPLDGVVHFELDIDYPFIHNIIDYVESECKRFGIRFVRIKPRKSWEELYYSVYVKSKTIYGFPTRKARWCTGLYKLDAKRQLEKWMKSLGGRFILLPSRELRKLKFWNGQESSRFLIIIMKQIRAADVCTVLYPRI